MVADLSFSLQFAAICSFSAKESNTLQLKKKKATNKKPDTESSNKHKILRVTSPAPPQPPGPSTGSLPVKDTVSSWEQDFMEDHFCHDAPDRPDVHYQISGD